MTSLVYEYMYCCCSYNINFVSSFSIFLQLSQVNSAHYTWVAGLAGEVQKNKPSWEKRTTRAKFYYKVVVVYVRTYMKCSQMSFQKGEKREQIRKCNFSIRN